MTDLSQPDAELLDFIGPYALDAMDPNDVAALHDRLAAANPVTRYTFEDLARDAHETLALMSSATAVAPPAALRDRVLDTVDVAVQDPPAPPGSLLHPRTRRLRWLALAGAAVVAAAAIGGVVIAPGHLHTAAPPTHNAL
ncbi:MAG: hypothetical protein HOQ24_19270 [Mycobacteriaceae bacterium]|nr:hypothetical protein [Mycobacteriaceae bacterium]